MPFPDGTPQLSELEDLPYESRQLLDILERSFPLTNPQPDASLAEIQREAGKQDLIAELRELRRRGEENEGSVLRSSPS